MYNVYCLRKKAKEEIVLGTFDSKLEAEDGLLVLSRPEEFTSVYLRYEKIEKETPEDRLWVEILLQSTMPEKDIRKLLQDNGFPDHIIESYINKRLK